MAARAPMPMRDHSHCARRGRRPRRAPMSSRAGGATAARRTLQPARSSIALTMPAGSFPARPRRHRPSHAGGTCNSRALPGVQGSPKGSPAKLQVDQPVVQAASSMAASTSGPSARAGRRAGAGGDPARRGAIALPVACRPIQAPPPAAARPGISCSDFSEQAPRQNLRKSTQAARFEHKVTEFRATVIHRTPRDLWQCVVPRCSFRP